MFYINIKRFFHKLWNKVPPTHLFSCPQIVDNLSNTKKTDANQGFADRLKKSFDTKSLR